MAIKYNEQKDVNKMIKIARKDKMKKEEISLKIVIFQRLIRISRNNNAKIEKKTQYIIRCNIAIEKKAA